MRDHRIGLDLFNDVLLALDTAADDLRDQGELCTHCPDQSCPACQSRLRDAHAYDQLAVRMLRPAEAAPAAPRPRRARSSHPAVRARRRQGGRPVTRHGRTPDDPGPRRQAAGPQVPRERKEEDMDMRELQDSYDLPFPTTPTAGCPAVPST